MAPGIKTHPQLLLEEFRQSYTLGNVNHGPAILRFLKINVEFEDFSVLVNVNDKLEKKF